MEVTNQKLALLGWERAPPDKEDYHLSLDSVPILSPEEKTIIHDVLNHFFEQEKNFSKKTAGEILADYCVANFLILDEIQKNYFEKILVQHTSGFGPLTPLLDDSSIEEIVINGLGKDAPVRVFAHGIGWKKTPLYFTEKKYAASLLNRLGASSGKRLSTTTPTLNTYTPHGFRLHASVEPVCHSTIEACIRKFVHILTTPESLVETNVITHEGLSFLLEALHTDCNILIAGNTGSGKTTTLNALLGGLDPSERIILVEETPELFLGNPHQVKLTPNADANIPMARVIRETLRMRPDRVVVGEIRFPEEAAAFLEAVMAGQGRGTYATFHGRSTSETIARLRNFGLPENDLSWINIIVIQRRWTHLTKSEKNTTAEKKEMRAITQIAEICMNSENNLFLNPIFEWNPEKKCLGRVGQSILVNERKKFFMGEKKSLSKKSPQKKINGKKIMPLQEE